MDFAALSRDDVLELLDTPEHPVAQEVERLALVYAEAVVQGRDPYELLSSPPLATEEVALTFVQCMRY